MILRPELSFTVIYTANNVIALNQLIGGLILNPEETYFTILEEIYFKII